MMKKIIDRIFDTKVDAIGLSVFRMCYTAVLTCEIIQLFRFRNVIFDKIPFVETGEINVSYLFGFWFVVLAMLFLGLFTRFATILNYIFGIIIFSSMVQFEYHVFYAYIGINLLLIFMPISRVFSLDALIEKVKYTNIGRPFLPNRNVLEVNYLIVVFAAVGLVYIDSVFRKFTREMWTDGLGMWLPSSLPMVVWNDTSFILNNEFLVKFLGFLVIAFEFVFIFLFWFKKFRIPFLLLGIFFHLGILIAYPIPWFALTAIVTYLLLVPQRFWLWISSAIKSKNPSFQFYYDAECPLCNKVIVMIRHFDIFRKVECLTVQGYAADQPALKDISEMELLMNIHGVDRKGKIAIGYHAYVQLLKYLIYTYPLALILSLPGISHLGKKAYKYIAGNRITERCTSENCLMPHFSEPVSETTDFLVSGWNRLRLTKKFWKAVLLIFTLVQIMIFSEVVIPQNNAVARSINAVGKIIRPPFKKFTGVCAHAVFMYEHFSRYNHIFKVVCTDNKKIVPILDDNGLVFNGYANGAMWVNYTFRVSAPKLDKSVYENGITGYLRYFEHENNLTGSHYKIYVKAIQTSPKWLPDFLHQQMRQPWKAAGICTLSPTTAQFDWNAGMQAIFNSETSAKP